MSHVVKGIGSFLRSPAFAEAGKYSAYALSYYADKLQYDENTAVMQDNMQQLNEGLKSFYGAMNENIVNRTLNYEIQNAALLNKGRQITSTGKAYYGSHGVSLFGSAVQTMAYNVNQIDKARQNLYLSYLQHYGEAERAAQNKYRETSILVKQIGRQYENTERMYGMSTLAKTLKILQGL